MENEKIIYALGFFDGVHRGHQALITACRHLAKENNYLAGVVTFDTHPETLVAGHAPALINTVEDRTRLLLSYQISEILLLPFDEDLRNLPWQDFLNMLLEKGAGGFVCGDDFRFGYRGEGNADKLADFCRQRQLPWAVVPAQNLGSTRISSTHIRQLLEAGEMAQAVEFLGHPHILCGPVVSGKQLGRTIGTPTANLLLPPEVVCPRYGVYACQTVIDGTPSMAVTNIGTRPTVDGDHVTVEAWVLDFDGDLYGQYLPLYFYQFLRPEKKFNSLAELQEEIQKNAEETRKIFTES